MASQPPIGSTRGPSDGVPLCAVCAQPDAHASSWCSVAEGLICDGCCARLREHDPRAFVEALSHADVALSPEEVARACLECAEQNAAGLRDQGHGLPS